MTLVKLKWDDAPTLEEMKYHRDHLDTEWNTGTGGEEGLDDQQGSEEDLYFQNFDVYAPEDQWIVKTGSAPADCDSAVDTLVPTEIGVSVRPLRDKKKYEDQAEKLTHMAYGLLSAWRGDHDVMRDLVTDMVIRRYGVARVYFDESRWPTRPAGLSGESLEDWEALNRRSCPVRFQRREPRHTRWAEDPDEPGRMMVVMEQYESTVMDVKDKYGHLPPVQRILKGREPQDLVEISDIWKGNYRCVLIGNETAFPLGSGKKKGVFPHLYRRIPYVVMPFRRLPFVEAARRYRGMLSNAENLYKMEAQALTMHVWMMGWNAWRTFKGWTKDGRKINIVPGQYIMIDQRIGEYLEMLEGKPVPPELLQTAQLFDSYIQRNGVSQGPRSVEGTRSGEQVWAIQAQRLVKIESAKQALQTGIRRALSMGAEIAQHQVLKDPGSVLILPVPVKNEDGEDMGSVSVRAADIGDYIDGFEVNFGSRIDPAVLAQAQQLMELATGGWMPYEDSVRMSGLTRSAKEWERKLLRQKVDNLDFMAEMKALEYAKDHYGEKSREYQLLSQRILSGGSQTTSGPAVPAPGVGTPTAMHGGGDAAGNPLGGAGGAQSNPQSGME